jgi:hypothetical protein
VSKVKAHISVVLASIGVCVGIHTIFSQYVAKAPKVIRRKFHKNVLIIPGAIFTTLHFLYNLIMDPII